MDDLTPPLLVVLREVRWQMSGGHSVKDSLEQYFRAHHDEFAVRLRELWSLKVQGQLHGGTRLFDSHRTQALWELLDRGFRGQPILEALVHLEEEVEAAAQADLESHAASLPFKALIPLLLFQFPAFAILLVGPLLRNMTRYLSCTIFLLGLGVSIPGWTESLTSIAMKRIGSARTSQEIERIHSAFERLRVLRIACDLQLSERTVPSACYRALDLELKWNLQRRSGARRIVARLDRKCQDASYTTKTLSTFVLREVSPHCREHLVKAEELHAYKRADSGVEFDM